MMNKQAILFDLDGTLTDPKVGITKSVAYALSQVGIEVNDLDTLCPFIGPPLKDSFMNFYGFDEPTAMQAISEYRVYFVKQGMLENEVYEGIECLLEMLQKQGKTLLVATSKPAVYAKQILEHFGLASYFTEIYGSELDGTRSKKAEVIRYALEKQKLDAQHCVMVGDRSHDIIGAKENQMESIGVLYGYGNRQELEDAQASIIVETIDALRHIFMEG